MLTKSLLTIAVLAALSASAQAGSTISDRSYWPNEARQGTQSNASQQGPASAFAYDRAPSAQPAMSPTVDASGWRYQGGPKSH
ncbi:hypothetical protein [Bradyrhizobium sp. AZCC 2230]|uniref:hypothetical protein n=1 Tax=Bradyrhizobium sp. AZCC 2230 TaxID=3117021 RepID=UPI002FF0677E